MQKKWTEITENLKEKVAPGIFKIWVAPLSAQIRGTEIHISAPNAFMCEWAKKHLEKEILAAAEDVLSISRENISLAFAVGKNDGKQPTSSEEVVESVVPRPDSQKQLILPFQACPDHSQFKWRYCFDDFITGPSNHLAAAAAKDILSNKHLTTLFINASAGLGKTHLAQATGVAFSQKQSLRVYYLTAEEFASRYVCAIRSKELEELKQFLCNLHVLILEDVHFLRKKKAMQEMILSIIKNLEAKGSKIIFTSSFSPRYLQDMDDQLISHFCSGILTSMEKPSMEMRKEILYKKAENFQINLPDEICTVLSERLSSDVRQLESCLKNMIFKAKLSNSGLSLEMALDTINQFAAAEPLVNIDAILKLVCESYGVTRQQLCSKSRKREYTQSRNTAFYLARKHTELSLEEIGVIFNRRHSTVIRGITQVEEEMARESNIGRQFARAVEMIEKKCGLNN